MNIEDVYEKYGSHNRAIKRARKHGLKIFINYEEEYWHNNINRLNSVIISEEFKMPFDEVVVLNRWSSITILKKKYAPGIGKEIWPYSLMLERNSTWGTEHDIDSILYTGEIVIENYGTINRKVAYIEDESGGEDDITVIYNRTIYNENKEAMTKISIRIEKLSGYTLYGDKEQRLKEINLGSEEKMYVTNQGVTLKEYIAGGVFDNIAYFYELCGEDFEVKIVDRPAVREKKGGKKKKPAGPPLFTIIRRPKTTVTIDVSLNKPVDSVSHKRGPLKFGHERRKHTRTYKHPRYINVLGKTITVESTHVGPAEVRETVYLVAKSKV